MTEDEPRRWVIVGEDEDAQPIQLPESQVPEGTVTLLELRDLAPEPPTVQESKR